MPADGKILSHKSHQIKAKFMVSMAASLDYTHRNYNRSVSSDVRGRETNGEANKYFTCSEAFVAFALLANCEGGKAQKLLASFGCLLDDFITAPESFFCLTPFLGDNA